VHSGKMVDIHAYIHTYMYTYMYITYACKDSKVHHMYMHQYIHVCKQVCAFMEAVDHRLALLSDERMVLKAFADWPEQRVRASHTKVPAPLNRLQSCLLHVIQFFVNAFVCRLIICRGELVVGCV